MNLILKKLSCAGVVPVVVLDDAKDAVPTAKALLAGGIDVMEITFRTAAAADSIAAVAKECPDMLVGAGTVITLDPTTENKVTIRNTRQTSKWLSGDTFLDNLFKH